MAAARPEAAFYRWRALTEEQSRVASRIHEWLDSYSTIEIPPRTPGNSIFNWQRIDDTRASNVILIDGPRGAGKTSLLLTLVEVWRRSLADEKLLFDEVFKRTMGPGETYLVDLSDPSDAKATGEILPESVEKARSAIERLRSRIIPIRVLDFAPLPQSTSIVTWVAAQLRVFIDLLDERTSPAFSDMSTRPVVPWEPAWEKELPSRKAWADLSASAAWGWDDNIEARKGGLDPDAYAEELQQAERARVGIVERWQGLIAAIVKDASQRHRGRINENARIVVPIDDVDMNPQRVAELLDFVRTFWDPQLVFVLTGDTDLILAALKHRHAKYLDTANSGFSAHDLAAQSYDKVVPLAQRFRIGPLQPKERVALLREQLPADQTAFQELLSRDRWAAEALPATLREVQDARQKLADRKRVVQIVADLWADALARDVPMIEDRNKIAKRVDVGSEGMLSVEADIEARAVRLGQFRIPPADGSDEPRTVRTHLVLEAVSEFVPYDIPDRPRLRGALLLAANHAANDPDAAWSAISIAGRGFKFPAVRARVDVPIKSVGGAVAKRAEGLLLKGLRWPMPNWPALADFARFAEEWRHRISGVLMRRDAEFDKKLAMLFLDRIRFVQLMGGESPGSEKAAAPQDSKTLKDAIAGILETRKDPVTTQRQQAFDEWVRGRALLLATPESGLQVSTAEELLSEAFPPQGEGNPLSNRVHQARFDRARVWLETTSKDSISHADVDDTLAAIDGSFQDHPWVVRFEEWTRGPRD